MKIAVFRFQISVKFLLKGPMNNKPPLLQIIMSGIVSLPVDDFELANKINLEKYLGTMRLCSWAGR